VFVRDKKRDAFGPHKRLLGLRRRWRNERVALFMEYFTFFFGWSCGYTLSNAFLSISDGKIARLQRQEATQKLEGARDLRGIWRKKEKKWFQQLRLSSRSTDTSKQDII